MGLWYVFLDKQRAAVRQNQLYTWPPISFCSQSKINIKIIQHILNNITDKVHEKADVICKKNASATL